MMNFLHGKQLHEMLEDMTESWEQEFGLKESGSISWLSLRIKKFSSVFDQLEAMQSIGSGHFGTVYSAYDKMLNINVAVKKLDKKKLLEDDEDRTIVIHELKVLEKLPIHKNICRFFRAFEDEDAVYFVMENCGSTSVY